MKKSWLLSLTGFVVATPAFAASNYRYVHLPQGDVYFGHVSYCEAKGDDGPYVLRGETREPATLNLPLAPGDTFLTTPGRRCEAQFDTGTILRLDGATTLGIETILAQALSTGDKLTNLHLQSGRIHLLYRDYDSREVFQVLTPNAAVKLSRSAVVDVVLAENGETHVAVQRGSVSVLYGPRADKTRSRKLKAGEQAAVSADHELVVAAKAADGDAFGAWNREMNQRFVERHAGKSALPKPLSHYPRAVVDFAQRFSDPYGEWIWSELYGYVWRPYSTNNEAWRPYMQGRWVPVSGHLFWVPEEPWGWVPYHLGLWHWDTKHGWVWIPGSAFAPAWVSWSTCHEARYYRPLSLWDWNLAHARGYRYGSPWGADPCGFYGTGWNDRRVVVDLGIQQQPAAPATPNPSDDGETTPIRRLPERPLLPLPNDLEKVANRIAKAAGQDGGDVRAAVERTRQSAGLVPSEELARRVEASAPLEAKHDLGPRFRDWNSDVRAARGVGGRIVYSSESNAVRCEDCRRPLVRIDLSAFGGWSEERRSGSSGSSTSSDGGGSAAAAPTTTNSGPNNGGGREKIRD